MNDDVEGFYTNPTPNERRSRQLSGLNREVVGGAFRYRIGIYRIHRQRRSKFEQLWRLRGASYTNTTSIPNCSAQGRLVLKKARSRAEHPLNFAENCAPARSIL